MGDFLSILISGLIMGSIYALLAGGLTLIWGVMRIVNLAHGEFLMLGCFATYYLFGALGGIPLLAIPLLAPVFFLLGAVLYVVVVRKIVNAPELMSMLLTFGVSIFIINISVLIWSGEMRIVEYLTGSFQIGGVLISKPRLVAGIVAVSISLGMYLFLKKTRIGTAIRAVSYDREIAEQCGINANLIYLVVFGIGTVLGASAGSLASTIFAFNPLVGQQFILKAFAVTVLGGMGNFLGALIGALIIGVVEQVFAYVLDAQISAAVAFVVIIATLLIRPHGIMGER
ncbi:MAG: branched-chain amino acid ABC transporter permease [Spirochaetaceae bacterium]|nr:MAG: branched-chain amino acid ABC transporter permease [Spirochaetaceae bacterium]